MHATNGRFSEASRLDVTLFIHLHVSAVGRAKASSVQDLLTILLLYPRRNSSSAKSTGPQTMYTPSPIKSAGVNSDQLWLCPCHPKTLRRNSLRRLQQTILHHCTLCTSANSFGMRGCQCVFYSERESGIRDINRKHTSMCIHYESDDHLKARDVTNVWKKQKCFYIFVLAFDYLSCNSFLEKNAAILY